MLILPIRSVRRQNKTSNPKTIANLAKVRRLKLSRHYCLNIKKIINDCISEGGTVKFAINVELLYKQLELVIQSAHSETMKLIGEKK